MTNPINNGNPSDGRKGRYSPCHQMMVLIRNPRRTPSPPRTLSRPGRSGRPRRRTPRRPTRTLTLQTTKSFLEGTKTSFHLRKDPVLKPVHLPLKALILVVERLVSLDQFYNCVLLALSRKAT